MKDWSGLPKHSRVWIYQSNRAFSASEKEEIKALFGDFLQGWNAHGKELVADFDMPQNQFIVLAVDESAQLPTGCSIDKSVRLIQQIENKYDIKLMDRMLVAYEAQGDLKTMHVNDFWAALKAKQLSENTIVYNNLVKNLSEFESKWRCALKDSWHSEYFNM